MTQLSLDLRDAAAERRRHKWWGNTCPACKAPPGELCQPNPSGTDGRIHGQRSRFTRPGQCLGVRCDPASPSGCWGCEGMISAHAGCGRNIAV